MVENVTCNISNGRMKIPCCFYQVLQASFSPVRALFFWNGRRRALSSLLTARSASRCVLCHSVGFAVSGNGTELGSGLTRSAVWKCNSSSWFHFCKTPNQQRLQIPSERLKNLLYLGAFIFLAQEKQNPLVSLSVLAFCRQGILVPELHRVFPCVHRAPFYRPVAIVSLVPFLHFLTKRANLETHQCVGIRICLYLLFEGPVEVCFPRLKLSFSCLIYLYVRMRN